MSELSRDELATRYFEQLPYEPYPVQSDALLAWFTSETGVLVCAPTGTGKTLIAEAALFEALHSGKTAYYTTPLIALTEQKFQELREAAVRWGFSPDEIGLVTGNRRVNPEARVLVVVAEILLNRLLHHDAFSFDDVSAVVMDEFHSFNDPERGIVWELSLGLLPAHVRLLLLSATVGNSREFVQWLGVCHQRRLELVEGRERRVPLTYSWVGEELLDELLERMAEPVDGETLTPALIFCFNREECWTVAELLKGKRLISGDQQKALTAAIAEHDLSQGAGPKLKQILIRGVGVHHAGLLPKYRRIVEDFFQRRLLTACVCTETLAAGINLPARSVVLPTLLKGPPGDKKLLDASSAHQMFGRAGRPQYDSQGFVFALAHEDDVKIARYQVKLRHIPEDTKDPNLIKARKQLEKKAPKRRSTEQYWSEPQFNQLRDAAPAKLASRGPLPWRLLAHMLDASPEIEPLRNLVGKRLLPPKRLEEGQKQLDRMLLTLWRAGYVTLDPAPRLDEQDAGADDLPYRAERAYPTDELPKLALLRSTNPLYGVFLVNQLGIADRAERLQALESILELPGSFAHYVRVPPAEELPPGPLATQRLDVQLMQLGLASLEELGAGEPQEEDRPRRSFEEPPVRPLTLAEKLRRLFDHEFPGAGIVHTAPVWAAGELLSLGGDFNLFVTSHKVQKQEGVLFRHLLRLILLCGEFSQLTPPETTAEEWIADLRDIAGRLAETCRRVDPQSTDKTLDEEGNESLRQVLGR